MTCFHPIQVTKMGVKPNGKLILKFHKSRFVNEDDRIDLLIPCGACIECRLNRSRAWAMRCLHEAKMHDRNCFITLTYDDDHVPWDRNLDVREFQLFMKRFRKKCGNGIRFYHCGEYGSEEFRPHYHACIFGYDFPDRKYWKKTKSGSKLFRSDLLESLWKFGYSSVGDVTFESAAYVARYICKKRLGKDAAKYYLDLGHIVEDTGELVAKVPEYTTMSRKPGIGYNWLDKYVTDVYPADSVIIRGKGMLPPKYYDVKFKEVDPNLFEIIKNSRIENGKKFSADNTPERLLDREKVATARLQLFSRSME